ncbi:hypothetical protein BK004_04285 [bacterium CG10_46_32]|nr:MAG: hypothetical protein BK004_04285 [bacterium CG10_46_32]PIR55835.1 MAG: hypothetical protein COU73_04325 [Parcubacteria group bacterium CG10_big_fil_rev_8_21_14_0_10_46_32]
MKYDIVTIGSAVKDTFLFLDSADAPVIANPSGDARRQKLIALEYGAKIDVARSIRTLGGGGINTAVTFARFGLTSAAVVSIGSDEDGGAITETLRREGIGRAFVVRDPKRSTGFSVLIVAGEKKRDRVVLTERGASSMNNFSATSNGITKTKWYYTSAMTGKNWKGEVSDIKSAASKHGISWAWNPGSVQLSAGLSVLSGYMKFCSVFIVNRDEALELTRAKNDIKTLLSKLLQTNASRVIISDGINGVYYGDTECMIHMSANKSIKAVEATGAGDAFGSGFVAGLIEKNDVPYALDLGITNSESVICKIGAQDGILKKGDIAVALKKSKHQLHYV